MVSGKNDGNADIEADYQEPLRVERGLRFAGIGMGRKTELLDYRKRTADGAVIRSCRR